MERTAWIFLIFLLRLRSERYLRLHDGILRPCIYSAFISRRYDCDRSDKRSSGRIVVHVQGLVQIFVRPKARERGSRKLFKNRLDKIISMAKVYYFIFCVFLFSFCGRCDLPGADIERLPTPKDTIYIRDTLIFRDTVFVKKEKTLQDIYTAFIGVREATGHNDGKEVEMFLAAVGLGKGYAWCAAFVKYCMLEAGIKAAERMNGMALSCENKGNIITEGYQAGDVFTLWYVRLGRIGHTGFWDKKINDRIYETVEGNTNAVGSREGDGVYRKKRSYNATYSISRWSL